MDVDNKISMTLTPQTVIGDLSFKAAIKSGTDVADKSVETVQTASSQQQQGAEQLQEAVAKINEFVQNEQRTIRFSVDEQSGRDVVTVLDLETKEVIRQIPIEEILVFVRNLNELNHDELKLFSSQA